MSDSIIEHFDNQKYTVIYDDKGFRALRYGEEWRSFTGDKLILTMLFEIHILREERKSYVKLLESEIELFERLKISRENLKTTLEEQL